MAETPDAAIPAAVAPRMAALVDSLVADGVPREAVRAVVSPYRICPLGAHSDHQHGPVLGMAIDAFTLLAYAPRDDGRIVLDSEDFPGGADAAWPDRDAEVAGEPWHRYALGAARVLSPRRTRAPVGVHGRIAGTLPGGGLSSSASAVVAYLMALADVNGLTLGSDELVDAARRVENDHVGVACGILDPASIVGARRDHLLAIDTAAARWEPVALGADAARFLVVYTGISRTLAGSAFNARVAECREAARRLGSAAGRSGTERLGELSDGVLDSHGAALPEALRRRARHFFSERRRVREGLELWRSGDLAGFGRLMNASCASSIHDYETGSPELVRLQELLVATPGVLGARFSGAGFGGCSIALVDADAAEAVASGLAVRVRSEIGPDARVLAVQSEDGARIVSRPRP